MAQVQTLDRAESEVDLSALETELQANITELMVAAQRLSLDALSDHAVRSELETVEHELAAARAELLRVAGAKIERQRRAVEAVAAAELARREAAYAEARELQVVRVKAAEKVDRQIKSLAGALAEWVEIAREQRAAFQRAGMSRAVAVSAPEDRFAQAALAHGLTSVGLSSLLGAELALIRPEQRKPLSDIDPDVSDWPLPTAAELAREDEV